MDTRVPAGLLLIILAPASAPAMDLRYSYPPGLAPAVSTPVMGDFTASSVDGTLRLRASLGATYLQANELVYSGEYRVSRLIWETKAPLLRGSVSVDLGYGVSLGAEGAVAIKGDSHMVDYDWLYGDDTFENWTHRSEHPETDLAHFWSGAATIGYELANVDNAVVRLHGGLQFTDVKWDAFGGSYVYSSGAGFRDLQGSFGTGEPAISYRQQMPEVFVGIDGDEYYGDLRVGGLMRAGLVVGGLATDDHWMRDLRFTDEIYVQPAVELGLDVGYAVGSNAEITLGGRLKHMFEQRGDATSVDTNLGTKQRSIDSAAASFTQVDLTAGLRARF
ncbi:omptin family outer membrane protease [Devosia albogilva]|uniref:Omptin family outer membrane protease n=1 Tax=Devosia albogilva TaxID=429726 RepID=A0ABW5QN10_9HYPH